MENKIDSKAKSPFTAYGKGAMFILMGILGFCVMIPMGMRDRFIAPGSHTIRVAGPETLTIYHEYVSDFGGGSYNTKGAMEGLSFTVSARDGGQVVPIRKPGALYGYKTGGNIGEAICSFPLPGAGEYIVNADYSDSQVAATNAAGVGGTQAVLAIGQQNLAQYLRIGQIILVVCVVLGCVDFVQTFRRRRQQKHV
jgi:hypothetical protein